MRVAGDETRGVGAAGGQPERPFRIAVLASGNGTNLQAIIDQLHRRPATAPGRGMAEKTEGAARGAGGSVAAPLIEAALVVSDVPGARALERARAAGIPTFVCPFEAAVTREQHDLSMAAAINEAGIDLVVMAGYMRLVSSDFVRAFPNRLINVHPALLPAFPGTTSILDAIRYGVKVTGVTVHFVDEGLDSGPIIAQESVRVREGETADSLAERIHAIEHRLFPGVIRLLASGRVRPPLPGQRIVQVDWGRGGDNNGGTD